MHHLRIRASCVALLLTAAIAGAGGAVAQPAPALAAPGPAESRGVRLDEAVRPAWFAATFPLARRWESAPGIATPSASSPVTSSTSAPRLESQTEETILQGVRRREGRETHIRETIRIRAAILDGETAAPLQFPEGDRPRREAILLSIRTDESTSTLFAAPLLRSEAVEIALDAATPTVVLRFRGVRIGPDGGEWLECDRTVPGAAFRWSTPTRGSNFALLGMDDEGAVPEEVLGLLARAVAWGAAEGLAAPLPDASCRVYERFADWRAGAPPRRLGRLKFSRAPESPAPLLATLQTSDGSEVSWTFESTPPLRLTSRVDADGVHLHRTSWCFIDLAPRH